MADIQLPSNPFPDQEVEFIDPNNGIKYIYHWRDDYKIWKCETTLYDINELDSNYVNVVGDIMTGDLLQVEGDTNIPGVGVEGEILHYTGSYRIDANPKLVNHEPIQLHEVESNGVIYKTGPVITGQTYYNKYVKLDKKAVYLYAEGDVIISNQWQKADIDYTTTGVWPDVTQVFPPYGDWVWEDISGATDELYRIDKNDFPNTDFPNKVSYIRLQQTISDTRGDICDPGTSSSCALVTHSNYLGHVGPILI